MALRAAFSWAQHDEKFTRFPPNPGTYMSCRTWPPVGSGNPSFQGEQAMTRFLTSALACLALLGASATPALAAPCKDAKGRFMKCH